MKKCLLILFLFFCFFYKDHVYAMQGPVPQLTKELWLLVFDHVYEHGEGADANLSRMYDLMKVCEAFKEWAPRLMHEVSFRGHQGHVTDDVLRLVLARCNGLQSLNVSGCLRITQAGLQAIGPQDITLRDLVTQSAPQLEQRPPEGNGIDELISRLQEINLLGCSQLGNDVVPMLRRMMPGMRIVDMSGKLLLPSVRRFDDEEYYPEPSFCQKHGCAMCWISIGTAILVGAAISVGVTVGNQA